MAYEVVEADVEGVGEEGRPCSDSEGGSSSSFRVDSIRIGLAFVRKNITRSSGNYQVCNTISHGVHEKGRDGLTLLIRSHIVHITSTTVSSSLVDNPASSITQLLSNLTLSIPTSIRIPLKLSERE